ncbi:hypothetical protein OQA88_2521 [Cercophora sp. LCS_1]
MLPPLATIPKDIVRMLPLDMPSMGEGIRTHMLPGVRCPTCAANGEEVWVIPGRACGYCRTPAPSQQHAHVEEDHH